MHNCWELGAGAIRSLGQARSNNGKTMWIIKLRDAKGRESFHQVVRTGPVMFDPRPGWMLLGTPIGARPRKTELQWIRPSDERIAWDRQFRFADAI